MKVEIWSDVMCPFCYIGKRKFEMALARFEHKDDIEVEWKSFQLNPDMVTDPAKNIDQYLAEHKGFTIEQAKGMNDRVTAMAKEVGLDYHFDKAIVANSFDAHRLSHLAKKHGKQNELEERLFKAYFTEGRNTADHQTLIQLATETGLDATEVRHALAADAYSGDVEYDILEARQIGVNGVPFFVLDRRYAVSGAQAPEAFLEALRKSYSEYQDKQL